MFPMNDALRAPSYTYALITVAYGSLADASLNSLSAVKCSESVLIGYRTVPPQIKPSGKVRKSRRVTTPKLLEPPFSASQSSGFEEALASTTWPEERTT